MSPFLGLPALYKLVVMLGGRVQVYVKDEDQWFDYLRITGIDSRTILRVAAGDENLLEKAKDLVSELYESVNYKDYEYLVPKNAMKEGSLIVMQYGFGEVVRVNASFELVQISQEEQKQLWDTYSIELYQSEYAEKFNGVIPKD